MQHFVDPFRLACESRQPRLIEIALECVDYLINHGYFRPLSPGQSESQEISSDSSSHSAFLDFIVDIIGKYVDDFDDGVQLQVFSYFFLLISFCFQRCACLGIEIYFDSCYFCQLRATCGKPSKFYSYVLSYSFDEQKCCE